MAFALTIKPPLWVFTHIAPYMWTRIMFLCSTIMTESLRSIVFAFRFFELSEIDFMCFFGRLSSSRKADIRAKLMGVEKLACSVPRPVALPKRRHQFRTLVMCIFMEIPRSWKQLAKLLIVKRASKQRGRQSCSFSGHSSLRLSLILNILLDCIQRRTANGYNEVARTPKVSTPQAILERRKLLKQSASGYTLETINQLRNLLVRLHPYNNVYVVNFVLSSKQLNIRLFAQLFKYLSQSIANGSSNNRTAILNTPNDMELQLVNRMATGLKVIFHTFKYTTTNLVFKRNILNSQVFLKYFVLSTNILFAGINPAQGYQIPPRPKGTGSPLVKAR